MTEFEDLLTEDEMKCVKSISILLEGKITEGVVKAQIKGHERRGYEITGYDVYPGKLVLYGKMNGNNGGSE